MVSITHAATLLNVPILERAWTLSCAKRGLAILSTSALGPEGNCVHSTVPDGCLVLVDTRTAASTSPDRASRLHCLRTVLVVETLATDPAFARSLRWCGDVLITPRDSLATLDAAIDAAIDGRLFASDHGLRALLDAVRFRSHHTESSGRVELTERERDVLRALADGLTIKGSARRLGVSIKTVEAHRRNVFTKLQVTNHNEAIARAHDEPALLVARS